MKIRVIRICYYSLVLIPQFLFQDYEYILISTVLAGLISHAVQIDFRFKLLFFMELIIFSFFFVLYKERIFYLFDSFNDFGIPSILIYIVSALFNALNVSILFYFGYNLYALLVKNNSINDSTY